MCLTLCDPMDCSTPGFPVLHHLSEFALTHVHWVSDAIHLILCHPLFLLPTIPPTIRVFSNESALCIRWPKYWSFSFSISHCKEYSGLTSFEIDWFDLLAFQGTLKSLLQDHSSKSSILWRSAFFIPPYFILMGQLSLYMHFISLLTPPLDSNIFKDKNCFYFIALSCTVYRGALNIVGIQ